MSLTRALSDSLFKGEERWFTPEPAFTSSHLTSALGVLLFGKRTRHMEHLFDFLLTWLAAGLWFTAKSLAIVCAFLMDGLPLVVKWPLWVRSPARAGASLGARPVPSVSGLEAQKWMDSISGPITFSLAHVRRDLKPCSGRASVRGQGSHAVHISMQVEAAWHWIIFWLVGATVLRLNTHPRPMTSIFTLLCWKITNDVMSWRGCDLREGNHID